MLLHCTSIRRYRTYNNGTYATWRDACIPITLAPARSILSTAYRINFGWMNATHCNNIRCLCLFHFDRRWMLGFGIQFICQRCILLSFLFEILCFVVTLLLLVSVEKRLHYFSISLFDAQPYYYCYWKWWWIIIKHGGEYKKWYFQFDMSFLDTKYLWAMTLFHRFIYFTYLPP